MKLQNVNRMYAATSSDALDVVCAKLAAAFRLPPFKAIHRSEYLETAESNDAMTFRVTEYLGAVDAARAARIGPPDYWNLAWRAAVGLNFNYQVWIMNKPAARNRQRVIARKLRSIFQHIQMHGDAKLPKEDGAVPA
jgi:hypothetical protein